MYRAGERYIIDMDMLSDFMYFITRHKVQIFPERYEDNE